MDRTWLDIFLAQYLQQPSSARRKCCRCSALTSPLLLQWTFNAQEKCTGAAPHNYTVPDNAHGLVNITARVSFSAPQFGVRRAAKVSLTVHRFCASPLSGPLKRQATKRAPQCWAANAGARQSGIIGCPPCCLTVPGRLLWPAVRRCNLTAYTLLL